MDKKTCLILPLIAALTVPAIAQHPATTDYYLSIARYDLSHLTNA